MSSALIAVALGAAACSGGGPGPVARPPTTSTSAATSGSSIPESTTATNPPATSTPPAVTARNLVADTSVQTALTDTFVSFRLDAANTPGYAALPPGSVQGITPGSLFYALVPSTGASWAVASFSPAPGISDTSSFIGFQDGGNIAVFTRPSDGPWAVVYVGPCTSAHVPAAVMTVWGLGRSTYPGC